MRYVIVDDDQATRDGRCYWLIKDGQEDPAGLEDSERVESCLSLSFEEALTLGGGWRDVDVAVVDGHDKRSEKDRQYEAGRHGLTHHGWDRYQGRRVVIEARRANPELCVMVTSTLVKRDPGLSRQMRGAGAKYIFGHDEVADQEAFVSAVRYPSDHGRQPVPSIGDRQWAGVAALVAEQPDHVRRQAFGEPGRVAGRSRAANKFFDLLRDQFKPETRAARTHRAHRSGWLPQALRSYFGQGHHHFDRSPAEDD